jgi:hypothetical protein
MYTKAAMAARIRMGRGTFSEIVRQTEGYCLSPDQTSALIVPGRLQILRIATTGEIDAARSAGHSTAIWPSSMTMTAAMIA